MSITPRNHVHLQDGRYLLAHPIVRSDWSHELAEIWWVGRARQNGAEHPCLIAEVHLPLTVAARTRQLQAVWQILLALQGHAQHLQLHDMFAEQSAHYFVFGLPQGQSLTGLIHAETMNEEEVRTCCLSVIEALHTFASLHARSGGKPRAYGGIHPSSLVLSPSPSGPRWVLGQPSLLLASGMLDEVPPSALSSRFPYYPPEFSGQGDLRADLYAVLACAYQALTGTKPHRHEGDMLPQAQWLNAKVSARMNAILAKGLHANPQERFHHPAELYEALDGNPVVLTTVSPAHRRRATMVTTLPSEPQQPFQERPILGGTAFAGQPSASRPSVGTPSLFVFGPAEAREKSHSDLLLPLPVGHEWRTAMCRLGGIALLEMMVLHLAR